MHTYNHTKFKLGDIVTTKKFGGVTGKIFVIECRPHTVFYAVEGCTSYIHEDDLTLVVEDTNVRETKDS